VTVPVNFWQNGEFQDQIDPKTYQFTTLSDTLDTHGFTSARVADRGGESAAPGPDGNERGRIDVPERPLQLVFGGPDKRTLFILTHHSLYGSHVD
jgi:hypothetical protein